MSKRLLNKINSKRAHIAVVGLGYIGLPLAVSFAKAGFRVRGIDTDEDRVEALNRKKSYILDVAPHTLAGVINNGKLSAHTDFSYIKECDAIIVCVPTPLKRKYTPDISFILNAICRVRKFLPKGALIVLESTTYPGTTEDINRKLLEKDGQRHGKDYYLAFSPERIDPGNKSYAVTDIPKLIGGLTPESGKLTEALYKKVINEVHLVSSAKAAEMAKLLENTFRIINIGWINEMTMMCHKMGIDAWEVIEAAKTKPFGFMPFYPGLGVGGHCIPDDPLYLYWKARRHGYSSRFIKLSADINHGMPAYALGCLKELLGKRGKTLAKAKVLIVGVTYKKDVRDLRKSPVLSFIELLQAAGCRPAYHDPYIPYLKFASIDLISTALNAKNLAKYDCVVVAVDHAKVNFNLIRAHARLVYDIKNVYKNTTDKRIVRF